MKQIVLIFCLMLLVLTGCTEKSDKTFQPLTPNPEYIVVIKMQAPNKVTGSAVIQGVQLQHIVDEINSSNKSIAAKSCPASVESFDVIVHYANKLDRTFTAFSCPGTMDQADGIMIEPGISVQNLSKLLKQQ